MLWKIIAGGAIIVGMLATVGAVSVGALDRFATKAALAALEQGMIEEIDRRSLGAISNDIKLAFATNAPRETKISLCIEFQQASGGQVHQLCRNMR